jgi:threonine/homoserine/homoserine lactone efflux protein
MNWTATWTFVAAATALLGSPGPGIAALLAVGRAEGWEGGLRYYAGLQAGLAVACGATAAGLVSVLAVFPLALRAFAVLSAAFLIYLAFRIATATVGTGTEAAGMDAAGTGAAGVRSSAVSGFLLGVSNPKAYLAFVSLLGSRALVQGNHQTDALLKWLLCLVVIIVVDLAWLFTGIQLRRLRMGSRAERMLNLSLGGTVLSAAVFMSLH